MMRKVGKWMMFLLLLFCSILPCRGVENRIDRRNSNAAVIPTVAKPEPVAVIKKFIKDWRKNLRPDPIEKISLTWAYQPVKFTVMSSNINVLAPIWLYVEGDPLTGAPVLHDIKEMGKKVDFKEYVRQAHQKKVKVWATIVSFTPTITDFLIHMPAYRKVFMEKLASRAQEWKLDGVNFDFENMNPADKNDFTDFIRETRDVLKKEGCTISVDVTIKEDNIDTSLSNWYQCYDHAGLAQVVDYMAIMAYDEHKNHTGAGAVASLPWVENKLQGILEDVPSNKILLGLSFYTYDFRSTMVDGDPEQLVSTWSMENKGVVTTLFSQIEKLLRDGVYTDMQKKQIHVKKWLIKNQWDEYQQNYYVKFIDQNDLVHEIWFDETESLMRKTALAKTYHLAGVAVWQQAFGEPTLWKAIDQSTR